ncbi:MAG: SDR family NAD(P)-dependent oxidoreductase [Chrysiogenales bacterium]|nr:MAG: SDR family NAD(P)-dependent oxidoreductase [Chrysiogenales bacterium]
MKSFEDKIVLLTGAATGIGRLMALMLADEKAGLALVDVNAKNLEVTRKECAAKGARAVAYTCDISKKKDIDAMYKKAIRDFGRVDILINNAGIVKGKFVHEYDFNEISKTMEVNFVGGAYLTRLAIPEMMTRNSGHIVSIASAMGLTGVPRMGEYVASKHAIVGFTDTLRMELKRHGYTGIRTLVVCPSGIDTGMFPGYKAPFMSPLLKPETVAERTLHAIKKGKSYLKLPFIVRLIPLMKLFPAPLQDVMAGFTGLLNSMDHFEGKK